MPEAMTIGQLAKAAGVNVETVRYYQRRGMLPVPARPPGGQRNYPAGALRTLAFIRRAQDLGFTLDEMGAQADAGELGRRKLEELDRRVAELNRMRKELRGLLEGGDRKRRGPCPLIRRLTEGAPEERR
jgi:MerR family transcriptional regulator, mercuric resistance operon regulatory protein